MAEGGGDLGVGAAAGAGAAAAAATAVVAAVAGGLRPGLGLTAGFLVAEMVLGGGGLVASSALVCEREQ